ncbi:MAG: hypothetical protein ACFFCD_15660 [Promethearchaeota archaeon]
MFDAVTIEYYKSDHENLRKVQPFENISFFTAFEIKTILDELHAFQNQLSRAGFMFRLLKQYQSRGYDANVILELMQRVVPHAFPLNIKAAPQETRLYYKQFANSDGHPILAGYVEEPKTKLKKMKFSECPSILSFI